jgi:HemY protein
VRLGVWAIAALVLGALLAHFLLQDRGYVLISFRGYIVEMSLPGLVLVLAALYFLIRLVIRIWRAPRRLGEVMAERRLRVAGDKLTRGLISMTEGHWARSERLLTRSLRSSDAPLVNYLMAARAAQQQGSRERRNEWLKLAFESMPEAETAILLTQAELQLEAQEYEAAIATLNRVGEKQPDNPVVAGLLAQAYHALGDTAQLRALVPRLSTADLPPGTRIERVLEGLGHLAGEPGLDQAALESLWAELSADLRKEPELLVWRAGMLGRLGGGDQAEGELRAALKRHWDARLVQAYGELETSQPRKQLKQAEQWLETRPDDAVLLLATARLCLENELVGKARSYLESSLALKPDAAAYALYGKLLAGLGEGEAAANAYRVGLGLASGTDLELPALSAPTQLAADR